MRNVSALFALQRKKRNSRFLKLCLTYVFVRSLEALNICLELVLYTFTEDLEVTGKLIGVSSYEKENTVFV